jgi:hypothetical protein
VEKFPTCSPPAAGIAVAKASGLLKVPRTFKAAEITAAITSDR